MFTPDKKAVFTPDKPEGIISRLAKAGVETLKDIPKAGMDIAYGPGMEIGNTFKNKFMESNPKFDPSSVGGQFEEYATDPRNVINSFVGANAIGKIPGVNINSFRNIGRSIEQMKNPPVPFEQRLSGVRGQVADTLSNETQAANENIGKNLVPKAKEMIKSNVDNMNPDTLKQIGVKPDVIQDIEGIKKDFSLKKLPTEEEADNFFEQVTKQSPFEGGIKPDEFTKNVQSVIDEVKPGLGKEHSLIKPLEAIQSDLKKNPFITKRQYIATRRNLSSLISGNPEDDRLIYQIKESLDNDAAHSGITGISKAKAMYKLSKETGKVDTYLNNPKLGEQLQSQIKKSSNPQEIQSRESLKNLIGQEPEQGLPGIDRERIAKESASKRTESLTNRENMRNRLLKKKQGRQKIATFGLSGAGLLAVPEVAKRTYHLLKGN